ncbi:hypothetical protein ACHAQJ_006284 [Trichoderma viride]
MNQFVLKLSFLYALAISFPATGFKIPDKLPNGLYEVSTVKTTGSMPYMVAQYDLELYRDVNVTAKRNDARNTPPNMSHRCPGPTDAGFDAWDIANAKMMLGIWCEMYRPRSKTIVMSVQGNNVWYMCSYKRPPDYPRQPRQPASCSKEEIAMAADKIDGWCGKDKSGSVDIGGWAMTYGRTHKEMSVCRKLKFRSTWLHRVLSGVKGGPGPDEDVKEKDEKKEKGEKEKSG